ncbi:Nuclease (SNase protein) [Candidatus Zixiibacteriota bacterium]|nr:Nuclease (SNase protein) [candidate division Zixibacteria bacterium]
MRMPKKYILIPILVIAILLIRYVAHIGPERSPDDRFRVAGIIDGDTIDLTGGDRLRLLGIDCPEKGEPYFDSAKAYLTGLILGKNIGVSYSHRHRDGYGRLLAYVYLDTVAVCREMLRRGLAHLYLFEDNMSDKERIGQLLAAQNEAIDAGRGVWSVPHNQERFYLARKGSYRFHRPDCRSLRDCPPEDLIRFESRLDPFRLGYSPCRNCRP